MVLSFHLLSKILQLILVTGTMLLPCSKTYSTFLGNTVLSLLTALTLEGRNSAKNSTLSEHTKGENLPEIESVLFPKKTK